MRVVLLLPTYLPETFGGAEQQTRRFADALARRGQSVTILAPRVERGTPAREKVGSVAVRRFRLPSPPNYGGRHMASHFLWWAWICGWLWRYRHSYDVVHVIHGRLHAAPGVFAGSLLGKPTLVKIGSGGTQFDLDVVWRKRFLGRLFARLIFRYTDAYIAISAEIADDLWRWGVAEERVHRIPNGVELPTLVTSDGAKAGMLRGVVLGRLDGAKAVDLMLRGFARLPEVADWTLMIVGDGPCRDDLEALAKELGIAERVSFTGSVADVTLLLRQADLYISTSLQEGMSNALLEAMSFRVVPLVSRVSGAADIIKEGRSGLLFAPGNLDAFAAKLEEAVALPPEKRREMGKAARETVRKRFSIDEVAERHTILYRRLCGEAIAGCAVRSDNVRT